MREAWKTVQIGDICDLMTGGTPSRSKSEYFGGGTIPWLVSGDIHRGEIQDCEGRITELGMKNSSARLLPLNSVIIALNGQGKTRGTVALLRVPATCNQSLVSINPRDHELLNPEFLFWNLHGRYEEIRRITGDDGNDRRGLNMPLIRQIRIPLPPPDEQQRIVAVLDKALAGIAIATANAQKNLTNARALFNVYLDATLNSENGDWFEQSIERCFRLKSGDGLTSGAMVEGPFPVFGGNGVAGYHNENNLTGDNVIIGRVGALCGNARHIQSPIWLTDNAFKVLDKKFDIDNAFLCYLLNFMDLRSFARQTAQPVISNSSLKDVLIRLPVSVQHQKAIVVALNELQAKCNAFEATVKRKLTALTELKQSLLQKAFAGELSAPAKMTNSSVAKDNFSTPQGTARIIAFAYRRHQMQNQQQTYGRVKAQKSLHLVESIGGIDLGRQPMKDAAGPNDFPHMLRAEEWAEAQGFFKFVPRSGGNGYDFKKLANYDALWADTVAATKPVTAVLEKAIDPIVPMVSLDAELFATVHAAWNNLIRDGVVITDDTIVKAARNDWHWAKLKIPEHKFLDAIRTIKAKGMEPDGSAKYVGGQVKLI